MFNLSNFKTVAIRTASRTMLVASKNAPTIFLGLGITGGVVATILACKATLKVDSIKEETKANFIKIATGKSTNPEVVYSQDDMKRDMVLAYVQGAWAIARLYAPAAITGIISVGLILQSHRIMSKRNAALMGAYIALDKTFNQYKAIMAERFGDQGIPVIDEVIGEETIVETSGDGKGNEQINVKQVPVTRRKAVSQYSAIFDEQSSLWKGARNYNMLTLKCQEAYLNEQLQARGHLFLNEVYDELGLPRTQAGCVVGWVYGGDGDNYVDIGWLHERNENNDINNPNPPFILDFNVDGVIYDKLR